MLSPFVLQRLSALNLTAGAPAPPALDHPSGEEKLDGCEADGPGGPYWRWERPVRSLWPALMSCWGPAAGRRTFDSDADNHPDLLALARSFPQSAMFLDLETCGFAGCAIFLVGIVHWQQDELFLTQLFARHYGEEQAVLSGLWRLTIGKDVLATFNGKSFDWPMVEDRTTLHRLERPAGAGWVHCDLLHHARRRWRDRLPDCRLQTLERLVCCRRRTGDVAGQDVPAAYHEYVRTRDPRPVRAILEHNALDLITLLELASALMRH